MTNARFLGTGAAGGTPGRGRSRRLESSLLLEGGERILIDVTRRFPQQEDFDRLDAILLTHGHADVAGGFASLRAWWRHHDHGPIPVYAHPLVIEQVQARFRRLDHVLLMPVRSREEVQIGGWRAQPLSVPHAADPSTFPTYAWKLSAGRASIVYASDVARPTPDLEAFTHGVAVLIVDAATYGRRALHPPAHRRGPSHALPLGRRADRARSNREIGAATRGSGNESSASSATRPRRPTTVSRCGWTS